MSDHCHERMAVQPGPGSALEVVETELLLELLMRLFADPTRLYGAGDVFDRRVGGQVREIVFPLSTGAMLAHQPSLFVGHMLCASSTNPLWRAIGDPHAHGGEAGRQSASGSPTPTDLPPLGFFEHGVGGRGSDIGHVPDVSGAAAPPCGRKGKP